MEEYKNLINGFDVGQSKDGDFTFECWMDYYKVGFRKMLSQAGERTLICALLPRKSAHINGVISVAFRNGDYSVDMTALCSSLVLDFYIKTVGASNLMPMRMRMLPLGIDKNTILHFVQDASVLIALQNVMRIFGKKFGIMHIEKKHGVLKTIVWQNGTC